MSQPISQPQGQNVVPIPSIPQEQPINKYDAVPDVSTNSIQPVSSVQSHPQVHTAVPNLDVPQTLPVATYNNVFSFPTAPALNAGSLVPKQSELPVPEKEILSQPTFSVQTPINAFNPFQSPQYQTGQATSIHQQLPQPSQQARTFYNPGSYPFYQYPSYSVNPYRYFFG